MLAEIVSLRRELLKRKVYALQREVRGWIKRCTEEPRLQVNLAQVKVIELMLVTLTESQRGACDRLGPVDFAEDAARLAREIVYAQDVWDYFRDKLEVRFNPDFQARIASADIVTASCYRPVMRRATEAAILAPSGNHEPPLTGLATVSSAQIWRRGEQPHERAELPLHGRELPLSVIDLPWDCLENLWELLAIPHEVGHALESDLGLAPGLDAALATALAGAAPEAAALWQSWRPEVFADLIALQLVGPPYGEHLLDVLLKENDALALTAGEYDAEHPPAYLRMRYIGEYMTTLATGAPGSGPAALAAREALAGDAAVLAARWRAIYPATPADDPLFAAIPAVTDALMDSPLEVLRGRTVRSLAPYQVDDDIRLRSAAGELAAGRVPKDPIHPRWCVSAARLAATQLATAESTGPGLASALGDLDTHTHLYLERNTPHVLETTTLTASRREHIVTAVEDLRAARRTAAPRRQPRAAPRRQHDEPK